MRLVPVTEIGLIEIPASLCRNLPPWASIQSISSCASGEPSSYSIPA
jgi:hypothetical protein